MSRWAAACFVLLASVSDARSPRGAANTTVPLATWYNVTPAGVDLSSDLSCGNYGTETVAADTANPGTLYTHFDCQGIWKSTDYGKTWTGPINTGTNGTLAGTGAGGMTLSPNATAGGAPTIYVSNIRYSGSNYSTTGFWVSTDGGVDWQNYILTLPDGFQDVYPATVDPYNSQHLLMTGHEQNWVGESLDGGHTWTSIALNSTMSSATDNTAFCFFVNTGTAGTPGTPSSGGTANTWLWISSDTGGEIGTWKTTNEGGSWTQVNTGEHSHAIAQLYEPGAGVVYEPEQYAGVGNAALNDGILLSTDSGSTWTHIGANTPEVAVYGDSSYLYALYGYASGPGVYVNPAFQYAAYPGTGTWTSPSTPTGFGANGGAGQMAIVNDGTHNIILAAAWNSGLWRYVQP